MILKILVSALVPLSIYLVIQLITLKAKLIETIKLFSVHTKMTQDMFERLVDMQDLIAEDQEAIIDIIGAKKVEERKKKILEDIK